VRSVVFYISGHGFGHASREIEIVNALGARLGSGTSIVIRTSAPRWLFDRTVRVPFRLLEGQTDTGVIQIDSLRLDARETIRQADAFYRTLDERAAAEAVLLRDVGARLVVSDAPPLGCAAARAASIPSVVCSNFTWDWIYEGYADELSLGPQLIPRIRDAYSSAEAGWRLPLHGGFETFETIVDVPFVARHKRHERDDVLRALELPGDRPLVLSSFGGYGVRDFDPASLDCLDRYTVIISGSTSGSTPFEGVVTLDERRIYDAGLRYEDLVAAVAVVATKPGYGIISECIANQTAMLYTSRGRFVEYDVMVREMPRYMRCEFIDQPSLLAGRWRAALDTLLAQPDPPERPATNGADVVADMIAATV
jgi:hypothetical protein